MAHDDRMPPAPFVTRVYQREFTTERLTIRAVREGDAKPIFDAYANDPDVARYMLWKFTGRLSDTETFVHECAAVWDGDPKPQAHYSYVIVHEEKIIGGIGFTPEGHSAALGYCLGKIHWGMGYGAEALLRLAEYLLDRPELFRLWAVHHPLNTSSGRVLEKCGFSREGLLRRHSLTPNISSEPSDVVLWAKTK